MAMTRDDHTQIKELFQTLIDHINAIQDLKMKLIEQKLDSIIDQTTKTNGTVRRHSEQLADIEQGKWHSIVTCPQAKVVSEVRDSMITSKSIKRLIISSITITGIVVAIVIGLIDTFAK